MRTLWMKTLALAASAVVYSHAIFGIGGQWAPAPGLEVKASNGTLISNSTANDSITLSQAKVSGLQGFGAKLWIDALPFIDIEAGTNIQWGFYDVNITGPGATVTPLSFKIGPISRPGFARIANDVTVLYPFLKLPPLVSIIKLSAGAGLTDVLATQVLTADFAKSAVTKAGLPKDATSDAVAKALVDAIKNEGLKNGVGFHLELSAKAKVPVIPIAVYADAKYYILNSMPKGVDAASVTYEMGGALAF